MALYLTRIVAVHHDVLDCLGTWAKTKEHRAMAQKSAQLLTALVQNDQSIITQLLRSLACDAIKDISGLVELGPKQTRGGAARLFLFRRNHLVVLVAAGIEKGSRGSAEIKNAKDRTQMLVRWTQQQTDLAGILKKLQDSGDYDIVVPDNLGG